MCHNIVELVKSNTKYCCRQPDIVGDKFRFSSKLKAINLYCRQPDIVGDKGFRNGVNTDTIVRRQPDIVGDKFSFVKYYAFSFCETHVDSPI